jgi:hypothetical protein
MSLTIQSENAFHEIRVNAVMKGQVAGVEGIPSARI